MADIFDMIKDAEMRRIEAMGMRLSDVLAVIPASDASREAYRRPAYRDRTADEAVANVDRERRLKAERRLREQRSRY